jgi:acetyltransferase-like isoleucine patch superfamily enzyme
MKARIAALLRRIARRLDRGSAVAPLDLISTAGKGSVILPPIDVLTNPESISVGENFFSREHLRLEAVRASPTADPGTLFIGDDVHLEGYCSISAAEEVRIGNAVLFGANVSVRDHDHGTRMPNVHRMSQPLVCAPVHIGDFVWVSQNAVILKGVSLGDHAVVGANAVVTRSFPAWATVAGIPARQIGWADGRPFEPERANE